MMTISPIAHGNLTTMVQEMMKIRGGVIWEIGLAWAGNHMVMEMNGTCKNGWGNA